MSTATDTAMARDDDEADVTTVSDDDLVHDLRAIRDDAIALEAACRFEIQSVPPPDRPSARNLVHYLALRQHDIRDLQRALAGRGLSSLGRAEAHVLATVDAVLGRLGASPAAPAGEAPTYRSSGELLARHTRKALGEAPSDGRVRLMVTLPGEAATNRQLIAELVDAGMSLARINCAHDGPAAWRSMAAAVRAEADRVGHPIGVAFDLAGPKLRTGPLPAGPQVVKIKPTRGLDGVVQRPGVVRFVDRHGQSDVADAAWRSVPVDATLLTGGRVGDVIWVRDTRNRSRRFVAVAAGVGYIDAECDHSTYLTSDMSLIRQRNGTTVAAGIVDKLPAVDSFIRIRRSDRLRIRRGGDTGHDAVVHANGTLAEPATISCELGAVFDAIQIGHRVLIDDGTIEGIVETVRDGEFDIIVQRPDNAKLRAEKGINLPDTAFASAALTADDRTDLAAIAPIADLVSLSFVRSVDDLNDLRDALADLECGDTAIGLKIEHAAAFATLPRLLLAGLQGPPIAVMLARGDLAIEVGFERLAEVQEQVLWLCEAAHVPVIWATQVAESLAKNGVATRAEVTDAAWASRAECVMLNKGPHILDAIRFLDDIFARMHQHQDKRTPLLRRLSISDAFNLFDGTAQRDAT